MKSVWTCASLAGLDVQRGRMRGKRVLVVLGSVVRQSLLVHVQGIWRRPSADLPARCGTQAPSKILAHDEQRKFGDVLARPRNPRHCWLPALVQRERTSPHNRSEAGKPTGAMRGVIVAVH